jgi:RNA polymerase sigma factor (sigma-70 family)
MIGGVSDSQLLARFAAHRDEVAEIAFAALVHRHGQMVLRVCQQVLGDPQAAEDAFQVTFLILARKAGSLRQPELLANWLHGVALRTARESRMRDDRRRRRELATTDDGPAQPVAAACEPALQLVRREELEALHDEVSRLPERYRIPLVLCELEGLSYQEAALRMRCPVGTIGVRLVRARQRLRDRLARRGLAPTAAILGAVLGGEAASAGVPAVLVESTVQAAMGLAASKTALAGLASASVAALAAPVEKTIAVGLLKAAIGFVVAFGVTATVGWVVVRRDARALIGREPPSPQWNKATLAGPLTPAPPLNVAPPGEPEPAPVPASTPTPTPAPAAVPAKVAPANPPTVTPMLAAATTPTLPLEANREADLAVQNIAREAAPTKVAVALASMRRAIRDERAHGEALFAKEWVPNDPLARGGDGLGPVYNESSCIACHGLAAPGGAGPESKNVFLVSATRAGNVSPKQLDKVHPGFHGTRSVVVHQHSVDPEYQAWRARFYGTNSQNEAGEAANPNETPADARIRAAKQQSAVRSRITQGAAALPPVSGITLSLSQRNTPALFGMGRLDAIPPEVLVATVARQPEEIRGRVNRTPEGLVGRFGWKAQLASLHEFVRSACANELGLEVPGHSQAVSPVAPKRKAKGLDLREDDCDALVAYVRALPAPVVIDPSGPYGTKATEGGRRLFTAVGCASCHMPVLGDVQGIYSDLLLHDMGQSLSDSGTYYGTESPGTIAGPTPQEWRTPPLWGFRDSGPYLHDGRASNLEEAVALHEGQARKSAQRFFALSADDRFQVEAFLKSLVAPSVDTVKGVVLAADLESRLEREEASEPEAVVRHRREEAMARGELEWREAQRVRIAKEAELNRRRVAKEAEAARRHRAEEAAAHARARLPIARALDRMGKTRAALDYYREIVRESPDTDEARKAAARIAVLTKQSGKE